MFEGARKVVSAKHRHTRTNAIRRSVCDTLNQEDQRESGGQSYRNPRHVADRGRNQACPSELGSTSDKPARIAHDGPPDSLLATNTGENAASQDRLRAEEEQRLFARTA